MSCNCSNNSCNDGSKCSPDSYSSEIIYDGKGFSCPELSLVNPNCSTEADVIGIIGDALCDALSGGFDGLDGASYKGVSITSQALDGVMGLRSLSITPIISPTSTGLAYQAGCRVRFTSAANLIQNYMEGVVATYNATSGAMTVTIDRFGIGYSGTHTDWLVNIVGDFGADGAAGAPGGVPVPEYPVKIQLVAQLGVQAAGTVWPGSTYTIPALKDGNYEIYLEGNSEIDMSSGSDCEVRAQIMKNGSPIAPNNGMIHFERNGSLGKNTVPYSLRIIDEPMLVGDVITVEIDISRTGSSISGPNYQIIKRS